MIPKGSALIICFSILSCSDDRVADSGNRIERNKILMNAGYLDSARQEAIHLYNANKSSDLRISYLIHVVEATALYAFNHVKEFEVAKFYCDSLADAIRHTNNKAIRYKALSAMAFFEYGASFYVDSASVIKAVEYINLQRLDEKDLPEALLAESYLIEGLITQFHPDTAFADVGKAKLLYIKADALAAKSSPEYEAYAKRHLSIIFLQEQKMDEALRLARQALKIRDSVSIIQNRPASLVLIGNIFREMKIPDSAVHYHKEAIQSASDLKSPRFLTSSVIALSDDYIQQARISEATNTLHIGLEKLKNLSYSIGVGELEEKLKMINGAKE